MSKDWFIRKLNLFTRNLLFNSIEISSKIVRSWSQNTWFFCHLTWLCHFRLLSCYMSAVSCYTWFEMHFWSCWSLRNIIELKLIFDLFDLITQNLLFPLLCFVFICAHMFVYYILYVIFLCQTLSLNSWFLYSSAFYDNFLNHSKQMVCAIS